jgi:phage tail protein X
MTDTIEKINITGAGLTVSRLIWNRFKQPMPGLLGKIYDLNPGLSSRGTRIPIGTTVLIPIPELSDDTIVERVTLWN